ncbi:MAG: hypothetical protein ABEK29_08450 [Bradymonadaceae bacterium]
MDADDWADRILGSDLSLADKGRMALYPMLRDDVPLARLVARAPAEEADNVIQLEPARRRREVIVRRSTCLAALRLVQCR